MIKKLIATIFILTGLLVTCCGGSFEDSEETPSPSCNINTNDCQHNVISFTLLADDHLKDGTWRINGRGRTVDLRPEFWVAEAFPILESDAGNKRIRIVGRV